MRVITVQHESSGTLLKVCENWDSFDQWIENVEGFERTDVDTKDCLVREEQ